MFFPLLLNGTKDNNIISLPLGISLFFSFDTDNENKFRNFSVSNNNYNIKNTRKNRDNDTNLDKFEEEANLWGLSEEDRRIAKEERLSPADYIEAEERDDDVLDTDEQ